MSKYLFYLMLVLSQLTTLAVEAKTTKKVAILVSGYATAEKPNLGYDLEELAQAYLTLTHNGVEVDIVSPQGGAVLVRSNKDDLDYIQQFKFKQQGLVKLENTLSSEQAMMRDYDGIFVVGGSGAMFDLPQDKHTQTLLTHFVHSEKPIAAVCHGPAALVHIKNRDGSFFVADKQVVAFTNIEEQAFGQDVIQQLPFLLEDKLKERGGKFALTEPLMPRVEMDGNLITAQNPGAVASAAEALVNQLGLSVKKRDLFKDEASLGLIARAKAKGVYSIKLALDNEPQKYDINYLALYGFYAYNLAVTPEQKQLELEIMQVISLYFSHPAYFQALIKAQLEQDRISDARASLSRYQQAFPGDKSLESLAQLIKNSGK